MRRDDTPAAENRRLATALAENRRLRAETQRNLDTARIWSEAVAHNIHEAPRWVWTIPPRPNAGDERDSTR
ncbi:hypothetical protein [Noviluteimonas dokdonensis]|uniref:hypothetical protein n=1 Tax=Noviluteimonas dokdonensis TaxID=414050 RepID=UPI0005630E2A|nr:hypothetical protein [Lysobacter dokdonensis]